MAYKLPWPHPYPQLASSPQGDRYRIATEIPRADANAVQSVILTPAILSLICQLALKQTAEYVRRNSLTYADSSRLLKHIRERTFSEPAQTAPAQPVGSGDESVRAGVATAGGVPPVPRKEVKDGGGRKRGKGGAATG